MLLLQSTTCIHFETVTSRERWVVLPVRELMQSRLVFVLLLQAASGSSVLCVGCCTSGISYPIVADSIRKQEKTRRERR